MELKNIVSFLFGFQRRLSHIIRFNTRPRTSDETVAAHSYFVALYVLVLSEYLKSLGIEINTEIALKQALLHDIEECISGDVMTHLKNDEDVKKAYMKISALSISTVLEKLPQTIREDLTQQWYSSTEHKTIENWIVKVADDLSGIVYAVEQINLGNKYFDVILNNYLNRFKDLTNNTELEHIYLNLIDEIQLNENVSLDMYYNK